MAPHPSKALFTGVGVALVTLFDDDGGLLPEQTAELAGRLVERGVKAVLVGGTTGEPWALDAQDRIALCTAVRDRVPDEIPVLLGTGAFSWADTEALTRACLVAPADAFLIMPPPGVPADVEHYDRLRVIAGEMPIWAYHVPELSAPGVPFDVAPKLDVDAMKDSSGDSDRLAIEWAHGDGRPLYTGSPTVLALARALDISGAILALANTAPELCIAAFEGDLAALPELCRLHVESLVDFPVNFKRTVSAAWGTPSHTRPRAAPTSGSADQRTASAAAAR